MRRLIDADKLIDELIDESIYEWVDESGKIDISYVRALIYKQPIAYDLDKVVEQIDKDINWYQFLKDNLKCNGTVITSDRGVITTKQAILQNVKDIIKEGGIDEYR